MAAKRDRLYLRLQAPFAACRPFVAGWFRPTAGFITHSAVYGLLLNIAGIESRLWEHEAGHDNRTPASLMRTELPAVRIAIGLPKDGKPPRVQTVYQQLHNYPVGTSGMPPELTKGQHYAGATRDVVRRSGNYRDRKQRRSA